MQRSASILAPRVPTFAAPRAASPNLAAVNEWPTMLASRAAALSIPTVLACRNLIVGAIVQMAIHRYRGLERVDPGRLITQPDPDTTWAWTIANTAEDLLYAGRAYWIVLARDGVDTERNPGGLPVRARWIPVGDVSPELERDAGSYSRLRGYRIAGVRGLVAPENVIRFDGALPGILERGAYAIANALELEDAAARMAGIELPAGVITNEGTELSDDEATELIDRFEDARRSRTVAFLQHATYERAQLSAEDLQLVEARANAATEMARLHNVPVAMVSASPSGGASAMLYANLGSQLALMVSGAVAPILAPIEQTLSLDSVTPQGQRVAFDVQAFLRSDPETLAEYALELYAGGSGLLDRDEARALLGVQPAGAGGAGNDLQPGTVG